MIAPRGDWGELMEEQLAEENPEALMAEGFDDALIGITANHHSPTVAVYDLAKCMKILMDQGLSYEEAYEYLSFNTLAAYVGPNGPLFIRTE